MDTAQQSSIQNTLDWINDHLANPRLKTRILTCAGTSLVIFLSITTFAYFFLPTGLLYRTNPLQNWQTSANLWVSTIQIFSFNMLSVLAILIGNLFAEKQAPRQKYPYPFGLTAFFVLISVNALVLGTWSFWVVQPIVNLGLRLLRTFDLVHRAGLWEMAGQMLIACATAGMARVVTVDGKTTVLPWKSLRLARTEWIAFLLGLALMAAGAAIESAAILAAQ